MLYPLVEKIDDSEMGLKRQIQLQEVIQNEKKKMQKRLEPIQS